MNGGISQWSNWQACDVTCGTGNQIRTRTCTNPPPSNNGLSCTETTQEGRACSTLIPCPGKLETLKSCGKGVVGNSGHEMLVLVNSEINILCVRRHRANFFKRSLL